MCGRYGLFKNPSTLATALGARVRDGFRFVPRYNVAPQQAVLGMRNVTDCELEDFRWGLLGSSGPAGRARLTTINARIEGIASSPLYGPLLFTQRCVLFADGYYEWPPRPDDAKPQPVWIARDDGAGFAFAALWDRANDKGEPVVACTIVTQPANEKLRVLHERMPVVLSFENARRWLTRERISSDEALALMPPADGAQWSYHPVGAAVGNVRNDSATLIAEVEAVGNQPSLFDLR